MLKTIWKKVAVSKKAKGKKGYDGEGQIRQMAKLRGKLILM
ncbi:MAG: hypothetical protein ACOX6N_04280 [Patescibacteria group bacterium]|jgi:hypothetical protein